MKLSKLMRISGFFALICALAAPQFALAQDEKAFAEHKFVLQISDMDPSKQTLVLNVGYSHPVEISPLDGVSFEVESPTLVHVDGIDKQAVGQQAALVRRTRPPEPYHGKGVRYVGEYVRQKAGKARV